MASVLKCMKRGCIRLRVGYSNYCAAHRPGAGGVVRAAKKAAAKKAPAKRPAAKKAAKKAPAKKAAKRPAAKKAAKKFVRRRV